jgi:hypothetical protein
MPQRFLKPGLRTSERWNAVSREAQALYIGLLTLVDDYGRYDGRVSVIWSECFAVWNDQNPQNIVTQERAAKLCQELHTSDLVAIYEVNGKRFLQFANWTERARGKSRWPDPVAGNPLRFPAESCGILPPSPSPQSSPAPAPASPPSPSVAVIAPRVIPQSKPKPALTPDALSFLRETLNREYRRPETSRWSCAEEGLLAEVSRRDRCKLELAEIIEYRGRLEPADLKFFPQSVARLLEKWDQMLDQARNYSATKSNKKSIHAQDAERLRRQAEKL